VTLQETIEVLRKLRGEEQVDMLAFSCDCSESLDEVPVDAAAWRAMALSIEAVRND
jgi:hypothetical protein